MGRSLYYALMRFVRWLSAKNVAYFAIFCVFVWQFDILIIERNRNIFWISFVVSENIRTFTTCCLSVTWDWRKDGTKLLIAQFPDELQHRKGKTSKHCHIGVGALCANFNICGNGLLQTCLGIWWGLRFLYTHIVSADLPIMRKVKQLNNTKLLETALLWKQSLLSCWPHCFYWSVSVQTHKWRVKLPNGHRVKLPSRVIWMVTVW